TRKPMTCPAGMTRNKLQALNWLAQRYRIEIVTARDPITDSWTKEWLDKNRIAYDSYSNIKEGNKHNVDFDLDVLVDDYLGNIESFLENSDAQAILFSQPWNQQRENVETFLKDGRLQIAESWSDVRRLIPAMIKRK
ncbi:MAG: hypothetical protein WD851_11990, partial [Pirellulales bacterium]